MKQFGGRVLFLDRSDINTDEIIPAKYLSEVSKEALAPHLLEDLSLAGFDPSGDGVKAAALVVTRANFGCGSSREHAPWALEVNDITAVIAPSFARIFRQNMFNCGMMAVELPVDTIDRLFGLASSGPVDCAVDLEAKRMTFKNPAETLSVGFELNPFDEALVKAGGWVDFADKRY